MDRALIERARETNMLDLINRDGIHLRRIAGTDGGEYAGPCPFCGGRDRFHVQEGSNTWFCRQCTGVAKLSVIDYVMKRDGVPFAEAVGRLTGAGTLSASFKPASPRTATDRPEGPPNETWQNNAREYIRTCEEILWSGQGERARAYLHGRGLHDETLKHWRIGFNPADRWEDVKKWGLPEERDDQGKLKKVWLAKGVVIPCLIDGIVWYVKTRRATDDPKYINVKGSRPALYGADTLAQADQSAVLTEGEFDALITWQALQHATAERFHRVAVCTMGSASNEFDPAGWSVRFWPGVRLFVCLDQDSAGARATNKLAATMADRMHRVDVPRIHDGDKDLTDFQKSGGRILDLIALAIAGDEYMRAAPGNASTPGSVADVTPGPTTTVRDGYGVPHSPVTDDLDTIEREWSRLLDELGALDQNSAEYESKLEFWRTVDAKLRARRNAVEVQRALVGIA